MVELIISIDGTYPLYVRDEFIETQLQDGVNLLEDKDYLYNRYSSSPTAAQQIDFVEFKRANTVLYFVYSILLLETVSLIKALLIRQHPTLYSIYRTV